jgi:general secretion pathway protein G
MRNRQGFTLLEILVVVLIITILATIVGVSVARHPAQARVTTAKAQMVIFKTALTSYRMEQGHLPTQEQGLKALVEKPAAPPTPDKYPDEGYLDSRKLPKDPWGHDYIYIVPGSKGEAFEVISYGSDGEPGGAGDAADISTSDL